MRIDFTTRQGKQYSYHIDALHIIDNYDNEYYIDDSTRAKSDETFVVSKYDHKTQEGLRPVWLPDEKQAAYYEAIARNQKIDEIIS